MSQTTRLFVSCLVISLVTLSQLRTAVRSILETRESNQMRYIIRPYYRVKPGMNIFVEYERERDYGHSSVKSTVTGGVSLLL